MCILSSCTSLLHPSLFFFFPVYLFNLYSHLFLINFALSFITPLLSHSLLTPALSRLSVFPLSLHSSRFQSSSFYSFCHFFTTFNSLPQLSPLCLTLISFYLFYFLLHFLPSFLHVISYRLFPFIVSLMCHCFPSLSDILLIYPFSFSPFTFLCFFSTLPPSPFYSPIFLFLFPIPRFAPSLPPPSLTVSSLLFYLPA